MSAGVRETERLGDRLGVAQVLYSGLGGHGAVAFALVRGDCNARWRHSMLFVGTAELLTDYRDGCVKHGVPFETVRTRAGRPWSGWRATFRGLRRLRPDVVILHSIPSLPPVLLYCLLSGARWLPVEHTPLAVRTRSERIASWLALRLARRVVVLTNWFRSAYAVACRVPARLQRRLVVIPNGIDVAAWRGGGLAVALRTRIGMAARFSDAKRQDLLVGALALLAEQRPELPWALTLAGDGECVGRVRQLAERLGCADRIEFPGSLDQDRLRGWYASLDIYAHATEGEVLSISMLQAMAAGVPVIGSPVEGVSNLLHDGEMVLGMLAADNTAESFAREIERLARDAELAERLADEALRRVEAIYSQEAMFASYDALIGEIR